MKQRKMVWATGFVSQFQKHDSVVIISLAGPHGGTAFNGEMSLGQARDFANRLTDAINEIEGADA